MMLLTDILFTIVLSLLTIFVGILSVQCGVAVLSRISPTDLSVRQSGARSRPQRVGIVVPAHNEATVIADALAPLLLQIREGDRVLVIADNCTDSTAAIARAAGCDVVVRHDMERQGKGYALDCGLNWFRRDPPDVILVIDADCHAGPAVIDELALAAVHHGRPVQARYQMTAAPGSGVQARLAEFAWLVKNTVRPLGFLRLGLPCQLMGSGMAFPWKVISHTSLANNNIVEDLRLGIDLATSGFSPMYYPRVCVRSQFPVRDDAIRSQRKRWEHGHLYTLATEVPTLLRRGIADRNLQLLMLALDLSVPPLSLLSMLTCLTFLAFAVLQFVYPVPLYLAWSALLVFGMGTSIVLSWWRFGRYVVSAADLVSTLWYVLKKIPLYGGFIFSRQAEWVKSKRDTE